MFIIAKKLTMKIIAMLLLLVGLQVNISAQNNNDSFNPAQTSAKVLTKRIIKINSPDSINPDFEVSRGTALVFQYEYKAKEYINMADDEMVERIIFQVSPRGTRFDFNTSSISKAKMIYTLSCFCAERGNYVIKHGRISGRKISKRVWEVQFDFTYFSRSSNTPIHKKFRVKFKTA